MNRVSGRSWLILTLLFVLLAGMAVFCVRYALHAGEWVVFPGSPHIYSSGNLALGTVTDRDGIMLMDSSSGRIYSGDVSLRKSIIHILGDRYGYISAPLLSFYADDLVEYDIVDGLYNSIGKERVSKLTICADAQKTAETLMEGRKGVAAVYNYRTGEILCILSAPNYDPDCVPDIANDKTGEYEGAYINRFYKSSYTPGSIFKVITLSAALETIPDALELSFDCEGSCIIGNEEIICTGVHGRQTLAEAFSNSCNCAFAELSQMVGRETLSRYAQSSGLLEEYESEGITVKSGNFNLEKSSDGSLSWAGIGQYTDLVNPCTYMTYMGMIANGGSAARPYLMEEITIDGSVVYSAETRYAGCGLKKETCSIISEKMHDNVRFKYGESLFPALKVCAKSGTAETGEGKEPNAMFAGFIDDERFPLAFFVAIEGGGYGSATAAPIAGQILQACVDEMK